MLRPLSERYDPAAQHDAACPVGSCDGSGWLLDDETNAARPCPCRERRVNRAVSGRMGSGIPKRFRGVSFDRKPICDLDRKTVLDPVRAFVDDIERRLDAGKGLWFAGDVGTGKTSLAMLVSKAALDANRTVAIYSVPRLLAEIKGTFDSDSDDSYERLFRRLCSVDLLHLDDLGAEKSTDWVLEQLYSIVNERWQDGRSIVVTSNQTEEELQQQIGERTVSRLIEICEGFIPIWGEDLRLAAG
jgi:DNA replication protein DnaC